MCVLLFCIFQEAMLILIGRLSQVFVNARLFLMFCALDDLIYLMLLGVTDQIQTQAALCISKVNVNFSV